MNWLMYGCEVLLQICCMCVFFWQLLVSVELMLLFGGNRQVLQMVVLLLLGMLQCEMCWCEICRLVERLCWLLKFMWKFCVLVVLKFLCRISFIDWFLFFMLCGIRFELILILLLIVLLLQCIVFEDLLMVMLCMNSGLNGMLMLLLIVFMFRIDWLFCRICMWLLVRLWMIGVFVFGLKVVFCILEMCLSRLLRVWFCVCGLLMVIWLLMCEGCEVWIWRVGRVGLFVVWVVWMVSRMVVVSRW